MTLQALVGFGRFRPGGHLWTPGEMDVTGNPCQHGGCEG